MMVALSPRVWDARLYMMNTRWYSFGHQGVSVLFAFATLCQTSCTSTDGDLGDGPDPVTPPSVEEVIQKGRSPFMLYTDSRYPNSPYFSMQEAEKIAGRGNVLQHGGRVWYIPNRYELAQYTPNPKGLQSDIAFSFSRTAQIDVEEEVQFGNNPRAPYVRPLIYKSDFKRVLHAFSDSNGLYAIRFKGDRDKRALYRWRDELVPNRIPLQSKFFIDIYPDPEGKYSDIEVVAKREFWEQTIRGKYETHTILAGGSRLNEHEESEVTIFAYYWCATGIFGTMPREGLGQVIFSGSSFFNYAGQEDNIELLLFTQP